MYKHTHGYTQMHALNGEAAWCRGVWANERLKGESRREQGRGKFMRSWLGWQRRTKQAEKDKLGC